MRLRIIGLVLKQRACGGLVRCIGWVGWVGLGGVGLNTNTFKPNSAQRGQERKAADKPPHNAEPSGQQAPGTEAGTGAGTEPPTDTRGRGSTARTSRGQRKSHHTAQSHHGHRTNNTSHKGKRHQSSHRAQGTKIIAISIDIIMQSSTGV